MQSRFKFNGTRPAHRQAAEDQRQSDTSDTRFHVATARARLLQSLRFAALSTRAALSNVSTSREEKSNSLAGVTNFAVPR